jgi:hypothetical protein
MGSNPTSVNAISVPLILEPVIVLTSALNEVPCTVTL